MGTRPKVHRAEVENAILRIARRRAKVDDPDRDRLPDSPDADPSDVLRYLRQFSNSAIPRWVLQADVCDALTVCNWLWWEDRRLELHFLLQGRNHGLFLAQLGTQLGIGKQGVRDRIDRLTALLQHDRPDEKLSREDRARRRAAATRRGAEEMWLAENEHELRTVIAELLAHADHHGLAGDEREWLDELAIDASQPQVTPTVMTLLSLAVEELRTAPPVLALPHTRPPAAVHDVLARADALRSAFAMV